MRVTSLVKFTTQGIGRKERQKTLSDKKCSIVHPLLVRIVLSCCLGQPPGCYWLAPSEKKCATVSTGLRGMWHTENAFFERGLCVLCHCATALPNLVNMYIYRHVLYIYKGCRPPLMWHTGNNITQPPRKIGLFRVPHPVTQLLGSGTQFAYCVVENTEGVW